MSTANIAQLAIDLLIASLSLRVIGVFDSRDLVPVVGGREDGAEGISTPLESELRAPFFLFQSSSFKKRLRDFPSVFGSEGCEIVVIQQRSPVLVVRLKSRRPSCAPDASPAEKARVCRCTLPVSSGIKALCDSFFVRRRHVQ